MTTKTQRALNCAEEIMQRHNAGEGIRSIAFDYGMAQSHMRRVLIAAGYQLANYSTCKSRKIDPMANEFVARYRNGQRITQIAREMQVERKTVRKRLRQAGVYDLTRGKAERPAELRPK